MKDGATSLDGRAILITGGGSGIGRRAAMIAAERGAHILVADINADAGNETVDIIRNDGGEAAFEQVDISSEDSVRNMVGRTIALYGKLDGAFNNAAVAQLALGLHDLTIDQWRRNIAITLTGTFLCMKYELTEMLKNRSGAIVNTSSAAGLRGVRLGAEYSTAKHGVIGLTRSAALEYAEHNIRINTVAPGGVRTPMLERVMNVDPALEPFIVSTHPIGRMGRPEEIAEAAVWLLSDAASFVTGATLVADGGYMA